eukprot:896524-Pleurochrysis_carterae.AAC.1
MPLLAIESAKRPLPSPSIRPVFDPEPAPEPPASKSCDRGILCSPTPSTMCSPSPAIGPANQSEDSVGGRLELAVSTMRG